MFKKLIKAFSALVLVAVVATSAFAGPDAHERLNADSLAFTRLISVRSYAADTAAAITPLDTTATNTEAICYDLGKPDLPFKMVLSSIATSTGNYLLVRDYATSLAGLYIPTATCAIIPWDFKDHVINQNNGADMGGGTNRAEFIFFTRPNISIRPSIDQTVALEIWGR